MHKQHDSSGPASKHSMRTVTGSLLVVQPQELCCEVRAKPCESRHLGQRWESPRSSCGIVIRVSAAPSDLLLQAQLEAVAKDLPGAALDAHEFLGGSCYVATLWAFTLAWASHIPAAGADLWPGCSQLEHVEQSGKAVMALCADMCWR